MIVNGCHAVGDSDGGKATTTLEGTYTNNRHAVGNFKRCQVRAIVECMIAEGRYAARKGHRRQIGAMLECPIANSCHCVGRTIVGNGFGDDNIAFIGSCVILTVDIVCHRRFRAFENVANAIDFISIGQGLTRQKA